MSSNLGKFNNQIENMLKDLIKIMPEEIDIKIFYEKFQLAKKANPQKILLVFLSYIYPYKEKILKCDEEFFLSDNNTNNIIYNNGEIQNSGVDADLIITKAINMKHIWKNKLSEPNKKTLWTYFKVLIILCEKYVNETVK